MTSPKPNTHPHLTPKEPKHGCLLTGVFVSTQQEGPKLSFALGSSKGSGTFHWSPQFLAIGLGQVYTSTPSTANPAKSPPGPLSLQRVGEAASLSQLGLLPQQLTLPTACCLLPPAYNSCGCQGCWAEALGPWKRGKSTAHQQQRQQHRFTFLGPLGAKSLYCHVDPENGCLPAFRSCACAHPSTVFPRLCALLDRQRCERSLLPQWHQTPGFLDPQQLVLGFGSVGRGPLARRAENMMECSGWEKLLLFRHLSNWHQRSPACHKTKTVLYIRSRDFVVKQLVVFLGSCDL